MVPGEAHARFHECPPRGGAGYRHRFVNRMPKKAGQRNVGSAGGVCLGAEDRHTHSMLIAPRRDVLKPDSIINREVGDRPPVVLRVAGNVPEVQVDRRIDIRLCVGGKVALGDIGEVVATVAASSRARVMDKWTHWQVRHRIHGLVCFRIVVKGDAAVGRNVGLWAVV